MGFPRKLLHEEEELVLDLHPHWWYLAKPTTALVAAVALGAFVIAQTTDRSGLGWDLLRWATLLLVVGGLLWFATRYIRRITTNFVVTSDRVIYRTGVFAKRGMEIPLERINTVFFSQSIFERIIGTGDLAVESGGETGKQTFSDIRKPVMVQNEIYRQMEGNIARMYGGGDQRQSGKVATTPSVPAGLSIPEQIEKLDELRQRGVISMEEFSAKKAELLERM